MDARTTKQKASAARTCRTLCGEQRQARPPAGVLALIAGVGIIIALPFALRAGAEFFLPVTAALVIAIALVPMLEWFERRGVPSQAGGGAVRRLLPDDRAFRRRLDRPSGDRLGRADPGADRQGPGGARAGARPVQGLRQVHRADPVAGRRSPAKRPDGPHRDAQLAVGPARRPRRRTCSSSSSSRCWSIFFFLAGWTGDAEADDRQPRQLRRAR